MSFDPYSVFDVPRGADFQTLRAAYRRLARENHPDIAPDKIAATARMAQINRAWAILGDADKRAAFDAAMRLQTLETARQNSATSEEERQETLRREAVKREIARAQAHRAASQKGKRGAPDSAKNEAKARGGFAKPGANRQRARDLKARKIRNREARSSTQRGSENGEIENLRARANQKSRVPNQAPPSPRALRLMREVTLAWRLWARDGRADAAIEICRAVILSDARNVPARELMSEIYAAQNRFGPALAMLDQATQIAPDDLLLRRKHDALRRTYFGANSNHDASPRRAGTVSLWQRLRARLTKR